jgi:hypothetical protein
VLADRLDLTALWICIDRLATHLTTDATQQTTLRLQIVTPIFWNSELRFQLKSMKGKEEKLSFKHKTKAQL